MWEYRFEVEFSNLYISSNENDSYHSAQVTSPGNIKGCVSLPYPLFLTYFSSRTDRLSSSLTLLGDFSSSNRPSQHEMSTFNFWANLRSSFFHHLFIHPRPTGPRNFNFRRLISALSFASVFFHVQTHSTRAIFLAVIKLLETHQYFLVLIPAFPFFFM